MSIQINPVVPPDMVVAPLTSTSKHVLRRRYEEVIPSTSASNYSFSGNSRIDFLLNAPSDFLDYQSCFFRADLTTDLSINGSDDTDRWLATGGLHSLIRELRVEASNGVVLQRLSRYNKWYAMMSNSLPQDYIENVGASWGDSIGAGSNYAGLGGSSKQPTREYVAQTAQDGITLCCQLQIPMLMNGQMWPLFLTRGGLRIVIELERPEFVLGSSSATDQTAGAGYTGANVQLDNPRMVCAFVQPSDEIKESYIRQFNANGISYNFNAYSHFLNQVAAGNASQNTFQHQANVRSARAIYSVIQNPNAEVVSAATAANEVNTFESDSIGWFIKANLSAYQYYSGSHRYPTQSSVDMTDPSNSEALQYYLDALGKQGSSFFSIRPNPEEWMERSTVDGQTDSRRLVLAAKLGRGDDAYSGLDLSLVPISSEFTFDAVYQLNSVNQIRYIHEWVAHDATVTLSKDGIQARV